MEDLARLRANFAANPAAHGIELAWAVVNGPVGAPANSGRAIAAHAEAISALRAVADSHVAARATARQDLVYLLSSFAHTVCSGSAATPDKLAEALDAATEAVSIQRAILNGLERSAFPVHQSDMQDAHDTLVVALIALATSATACGQIPEARDALHEAWERAQGGLAPFATEALNAIHELRKQVNPLRLLPSTAGRSRPKPGTLHG